VFHRPLPAALFALGLLTTVAPVSSSAAGLPFNLHAKQVFNARHAVNPTLKPVPDLFLPAYFTRPIPAPTKRLTFRQVPGQAKKQPLNYVFISDNATGDLSIYDEATLTLQAQGPGLAGWGVAADKKGHVCWGTLYATIACGVCRSARGLGPDLFARGDRRRSLWADVHQ
jgi:hypothetical protein